MAHVNDALIKTYLPKKGSRKQLLVFSPPPHTPHPPAETSQTQETCEMKLQWIRLLLLTWRLLFRPDVTLRSTAYQNIGEESVHQPVDTVCVFSLQTEVKVMTPVTSHRCFTYFGYTLALQHWMRVQWTLKTANWKLLVHGFLHS